VLRIVADANVYVSAAIAPRGQAARVIDWARNGLVQLTICDTLCDELTDVLARDRFRRWLTLDEATEFVDAMILLARWVAD
jgi:predicted nucleic acid-binding protein